MNDIPQKRRIGVIPPHEHRNKRYLEEFRAVVIPSWRIIPHTLFYKTSFAKLMETTRKGAAFDIVIAARTRDQENPDADNIHQAAREIRLALRQNTVFIICFNALLAGVLGLEPEAEQRVIMSMVEYGNDPFQDPIGGVIRTTSTDPVFLISIISDVLDGPRKYLEKSQVYGIETQAQFLNHPPGHTRVGMGQ